MVTSDSYYQLILHLNLKGSIFLPCAHNGAKGHDFLIMRSCFQRAVLRRNIRRKDKKLNSHHLLETDMEIRN